MAEKFNQIHREQQGRANPKRKPPTPFRVRDRFWALRPLLLQGQKLESWWLGPTVVLARAGNSTYRVQHKQSDTWVVHMDFFEAMGGVSGYGYGVTTVFWSSHNTVNSL